MPIFAALILPLAIPKSLIYEVPPALQGLSQPGSRAIVPLGKKKIITGIIQHILDIAPSYPTKPIIDIIDETPIINPMQLDFFQWLAEYYMCYLGEIVKTALPSGFKLSSQSKIQLNPAWDPSYTTSLSPAEQQIVTQLTKQGIINYQQLLKDTTINKQLKKLIHNNVVLLFEELQEKYQPKKEKRISLHETYMQHPGKLQELCKQLENKPSQLDILLQYLSLVPTPTKNRLEPYFLPKKQLLKMQLSLKALQNLIKKKIFLEQDFIVSRIASIPPTKETNIILSPTQNKVLVAIQEQFNHKNTVLLYGVTGSGKTEIYIHLIQEALKTGNQVLYLLPEIGLATQIVKRLQKIFGNQVGVYHSKYASNERVEVWNNLLQSKINLVIGVRSALFLPFNKLKLIIVDEEHEPAYKQLDAVPRYHARDAALMLAQYHSAKVLLGSATPAIETYYHAQSGKYGLVTLEERFNQTPLPKITLVDLRAEEKQKKLRGEFSQTLLEAMQKSLAQKEQVIIFQNRRGYSPYIRCQACAWVPNCQRCSVSLTYHQFNNYLVCHYCGYRTNIPANCEICASSQLLNVGFGTEKLEETLQQFFAGEHIQRMDLDTTRSKNSYAKIIESLEQGKTSILVGTQMITKGLDFGQVSLVGVMDVDRHLYFPDFRAHERCFQLITQVGGRAGRRHKQGKVLIQTTNPTHPTLQHIVAHAYQQMYEQELLERHKFLYPPYVRLIKITLQHTDKKLLTEAAENLAVHLTAYVGKEWVLGPQAPLIAKIKHQHRIDIWIKIRKSFYDELFATKQKIKETTQKVLSNQNFRHIKAIFDVDPV
jgi:primosomal protein N' (replication factor Y)